MASLNGTTARVIRCIPAKVMEFCFSFDPAGKTYVFNLLRVSATVVILSTGGLLAFLLLGGNKRKKSGTPDNMGKQD